MRLVVTGASGFIGTELCSRLLTEGHKLTLLTHRAPREPRTEIKKWLHWTPGTPGDWESALEEADGVINLAGEPIAAKRWTATQKRKIRISRIDVTNSLIGAIAKAKRKPAFLLNASAVGYYGPHGDEIITEDTPPGNDFLSTVCRDWEAEANKAEALGLRVIRIRTGIVLGRDGGALPKMALPFKFFAGGPVGSGKQWMPWIHLNDEVGMMLHFIDNSNATGPFNATAPNPVTNNEFSRTLGNVMGRPSFLWAPAVALRVMLGEMAGMLLASQRVIPAAAQRLGYEFRYPNLYDALKACTPI